MTKFFKNFRKYFREYCTNTSIHGFCYFGERRTIFERFWWCSALLISLSLCCYCIFTIYEKWERSPITVSLANKDASIYEIPFPAVTICPVTKTNVKKFNYTEMYHKVLQGENISETEQRHFEYVTMICGEKILKNPILNNFFLKFNSTNAELKIADDFKNESLDYIFKIMDKLNSGSSLNYFSQEFYDYIDKVKSELFILNSYTSTFHFRELDFNPVLTEEGICYSYNLLDRNEMFRENVIHYKNYQVSKNSSPYWSIEYGYKKPNLFDWLLESNTQYPYRAHITGIEAGLKLQIISVKSNLDHLCSSENGQGYKVMLHSPTTFPRPSENYFMLSLDTNVVAAVLPSMTTTSESLRNYSKDKRKCYFQSERHLNFFKIYSRENCELECLANLTLDKCGCVNFFMPRDNDTNICGTGNMFCLNMIQEFFLTLIYVDKFEKQHLDNTIPLYNCDCLPLCTELIYDVEVSKNVWDWKEQAEALNNAHSIENVHLSALTIYYKTNTFTKFERHAYYGPIDFLANFGGLLGLFTGVSVISVIEILYFSTLRILCNKWLYGRWAGHDSQN